MRQDTFYLDLSMHQTPHWLGAEMAEQLRASVDARLTLDAEFAQVSAHEQQRMPECSTYGFKGWHNTAHV